MHLHLLVVAALLAGCAGSSPNPTNPTPTTSTTNGPGATVACDPVPVTPDAAWSSTLPHVVIKTTKGDITIELESERAPNTTANFLSLVRAGYYDGQSFYRVAKGFVIQGGSRTGADKTIPDEFNPTLRHSAAGMLSMATRGPDTGSSEFFITLSPTPSLDDRHAVFGHVVSGMDVVTAIGALSPASGDGAPTEAVTLSKAQVVEGRPYDATHGVGIHSAFTSKKEEPGRAVTFAVILENHGNVRDAIGLKATIPQGWTCGVDARPVIAAGTARIVFLKLTPPADATGTATIPIAAVSSWSGVSEATSSVQVVVGALGAQVADGSKVTANYVGLLPDGRLFDTSVATVGQNDAQPKFNTTGGWQAHPSYSTFPFTVGSGVIAGFTNLAKTAKEGETVTSRIPAKDAYATGDMYQRPLTGRELVFELEIVKLG